MTHSIRTFAVVTALLAIGCTGDDDPELTGDTGDTPVEVDADNDGVPVDGDCDDNDKTVGAIADDADCDGILTADDCDDNDDTSTAIADDADCDGALTADDCDDTDATLGAIANDADCDGTLTADDCDDNDDMSTVVADDADCDGSLTVDDCDDNDPAAFPGAAEITSDGIDQDCDTFDVESTAIVLNEFHYDPEGGDPENPGEGGDANHNGIREAQTDEFVELVNTSASAVDLSGFTFFEENADPTSGTPRHTVPADTVLAPGQAFVLFGAEDVDGVGPSEAGIDQRQLLLDGSTNPNFGMVTFDFGGAVVQGCNGLDNRLNLNNSGDSIFVVDSLGNTFISFDIRDSGGSDQSVTRDPDITGPYAPSTTVGNNANFTPGTQNDGTPF